jgi:hypothetical protein
MVIRLRRHVGNNVVGYIALIVAVMGVPMAWALAPNSVGTKQIKPSAVRSSDVKNNALHGADVDETKLGRVPSAASAQNAQNAVSAQSAQFAQTAQSAQNADFATNAGSASFALNAQNSDAVGGMGFTEIGGVGRAATGGCTNVISIEECASVGLTLNRSARVLGIASAVANAQALDGPSPIDNPVIVQGRCDIRADGTPMSAVPSTLLFHGVERQSVVPLGVTASPLAAGPHTFTVVCEEQDGNIEWENVQIAVVILGSA